MKKAAWLTGLLGLIFALAIAASQANFIQCTGGPCGVAEGVTEEADLINGSNTVFDGILGLGGNDIIFGNDGQDDISAGDGDDFASGGPDVDSVIGDGGNDILHAGPDDGELSQVIIMGTGTDMAFVLASEVTTCLFINDTGDGPDVVNLLGFGPYTAILPFGQTGFGDAYVYVVDPVTGGEIFIRVTENTDDGVEIIHGLPSPNVTILPTDSDEREACPIIPFAG